MWVVPDRKVVVKLRGEIARLRGERYRNFYDIRWNEQRGCLSTYMKNFEGRESVFEDLRGDDGSPRQCHMGDVDSVLCRLYGRDKAVDNWRANMEKKKADEKLRIRAERRGKDGYITRTAQEAIRVARGGARAYAIPEAPKPNGDGFTVNDRREVR